MEDEAISSIRYIVLLEDTPGGRMAKFAFPTQALYSRYLIKKDIKPQEARCAYVQLMGEHEGEMHVFYCQWVQDGPWDLSGYSLDSTPPEFPMVPYDVREDTIRIVSRELLDDENFSFIAKGTISRVSQKIAEPIRALDFDLWSELRSIPFVYKLACFLSAVAVVTFFVMRMEPPRFAEEVVRVPWLLNGMSDVSYFEGDGRLVFEGEIDSRAIRRYFKGLEVIAPGQPFLMSRYTLYRDAGSYSAADSNVYWTPEGYESWLRGQYVTIFYGYAQTLPNGSSLAYDFATNKLYGNLRDASELVRFSGARPKDL